MSEGLLEISHVNNLKIVPNYKHIFSFKKALAFWFPTVSMHACIVWLKDFLSPASLPGNTQFPV